MDKFLRKVPVKGSQDANSGSKLSTVGSIPPTKTTPNASQSSAKSTDLSTNVSMEGGSTSPSPVTSTPKSTRGGLGPPGRPTSSCSAVKDSTPKSANSRTGWTVILVKMGSAIQTHILCQRGNGVLGPYSSAPSASKNRPTWEPIKSCEYLVQKSGEQTKRLFLFKNSDNESAMFRADRMSPLLVTVNMFTQKVADLLVNKPTLLAAYLTLLSSSENFSNFKEDVVDKNGFRKDGGGFTSESLDVLGGSLEDFKDFIKAAVEVSVDIGAKDDAMKGVKISPASNKRKLTDFFNQSETKKLSKSDVKEKNYQAMISEEGGLEKTVASSYVQIQPISLDKLAVSPDLFLPIDMAKVNDLAESMTDR